MSTTEALPEMIEAALAELLHAQVMLGMATARCMPTPDMPEVLAASKALTSVCDAIRAALAQPAASGETVAYLVRDVGGKRGTGMLVRACDIDSYQRATLEREPLYIAQPAPARVPLTDAQISNMWAHECVRERLTRDLVLAFARAIEAAHGITAPGAPDAGPVQ